MAVQQLANFFGTTTETIIQNAPTWLAKFGWFTLMQNIVSAIILWIGIIVILFILIISTGYINEWKIKFIIELCILSVIVFTIIVFGAWYLQCAVSPELYGLKAILVLIK